MKIEDLIKIANTQDTLSPSSVGDANDVQKFILVLKLKEGTHFVKNRALYEAYRSWSGKPLKRNAFFQHFSKYFTCKAYKDVRYYKLNYRPIELYNKIDNLKIKL